MSPARFGGEAIAAGYAAFRDITEDDLEPKHGLDVCKLSPRSLFHTQDHGWRDAYQMCEFVLIEPVRAPVHAQFVCVVHTKMSRIILGLRCATAPIIGECGSMRTAPRSALAQPAHVIPSPVQPSPVQIGALRARNPNATRHAPA